jgi:FRG domain
MGEVYENIPCNDFSDFVIKVKELPRDKRHRWVFKGLENASWSLKTTLERECERFGISGDDVHRREYNMIREFQRRLHHYEVSIPARDDVDEWMALMQHYGAPTRLLDFTYSHYVAAFFAFEKATSGDVAIWAVNTEWISKKFKSSNPRDMVNAYEKYGNYRDPDAFRLLFLKYLKKRYVLAINPFRLIDRLAYQQGLFLCPASVSAGFMENLGGLVRSRQNDSPVKKFIINIGEKSEHRDEALRQLNDMNINRITLFPGLVGFAESCKVGVMTVFGEHKVMSKGVEIPVRDLWEMLSKSKSG